MIDYSKAAKVGDLVRIHPDAPFYKQYQYLRGKTARITTVIPPNEWVDDYYYVLEGLLDLDGKPVTVDWEYVDVIDEFVVEVINANKETNDL